MSNRLACVKTTTGLPRKISNRGKGRFDRTSGANALPENYKRLTAAVRHCAESPRFWDASLGLCGQISQMPVWDCCDFGSVGSLIASAAEMRNLTEGLKQYRADGVTALPPCSYKLKRMYRKRSSLERLNSRLADVCMLRNHCRRGIRSVEFKFNISMEVMLAAANVAIESQRPKQTRSPVRNLAV